MVYGVQCMLEMYRIQIFEIGPEADVAGYPPASPGGTGTG